MQTQTKILIRIITKARILHNRVDKKFCLLEITFKIKTNVMNNNLIKIIAQYLNILPYNFQHNNFLLIKIK
jgi:hypothetical protein